MLGVENCKLYVYFATTNDSSSRKLDFSQSEGLIFISKETTIQWSFDNFSPPHVKEDRIDIFLNDFKGQTILNLLLTSKTCL